MHAPPQAVASRRERFLGDKAALFAALPDGASTRGLRRTLQRAAALTDDLLRGLWRDAGLPEACSLAAVGGYGRGELYPHSDVDVLILLPEGSDPEADPALKACIERFIGSCWDSGLDIGSSVRTPSQCTAEAARDVTVQTALLESRPLAGAATLYRAFRRGFEAALDPKAFFIAKTLELRQRHHKFENTPYALEPNCKESPGGLRDLQVILWVARAAGYGSTWDELARKGLATPLEVRQIKRNEALLALIRTRLHLAARRREDRLVFDLQTAVAERFGFVNRLGPDGRVLLRASEVLMRQYYWAAKAVAQLNQILLLNIEERLSTPEGSASAALRPINERFFDKAGMIEVASDDLYQREPHAILETFLVYQTTVGVKGLSARTLRALYNARGLMDARFRRDPVNRATFVRILQEPQGITHAMRLMNQTSVLGRYLWVFRRIVGQMQHDLFHVYTVDQHILMVLRNVRRFFMPEHTHEYPFCSQLAAGWDKPWLLYLAALFHDIAKGRGGDHSALGAQEVRRFCRAHGIAREDAELVEFLVREHLLMSQVAQKQDLGDPDVIAAFAQRVGTERRLTALYLLTVADIRGTSPKVWNAWKGKLLEDLYRATRRALGASAPDAQTEVQSRKREAEVLLALHALPFEAHRALWDTLDVGYFMRHDADDIAWHARQITRHLALGGAGAQAPLVKSRRSPVGEGLQVLVYSPDRADLFARICGYFERAGFSILDAKIHTTADGHALDSFQVVSANLHEHYRELITMVENGLAQAIDATGALPAPARARVSRRVRSFPITPRVDLRPDEKGQRWVLSVSASDRPGLLYAIARVLAAHRVNLQLAKVSTLGERVEDTFVIEGEALQHSKAQIEIETELLQALAAD
ncbi:[protein-PII] uridylyltransferase [Tibeticola sp.]|uniref:[protein-PII] uridylyltransferase n=1 Tax=Tibeticola sp. TaxID=2005368 RepID=UPI0025F91227|nr:[protein-PII] uridylyltransferase [Tibeticola sp.]